MKFEIFRVSNWEYEGVKEINTLEELIKFVNENGQVVLRETEVNEDPDRPDMTIEIYDSWRE